MKVKINHKIYPDAIIADCCNEETTDMYCFEGQDIKKLGMCGDCFSEWLATNDATIEVSDELVGEFEKK
jgi:hypothetical protein